MYWRARQHPSWVPKSQHAESSDIFIILSINNETCQHFSRPLHSLKKPAPASKEQSSSGLPSLPLYGWEDERPPQGTAVDQWQNHSSGSGGWHWHLIPEPPDAAYLAFTLLCICMFTFVGLQRHISRVKNTRGVVEVNRCLPPYVALSKSLAQTLPYLSFLFRSTICSYATHMLGMFISHLLQLLINHLTSW